MSLLTRFAMFLNVLAALFGVYNELTPTTFPLRRLEPGMGLAVAIISLTMLFTLEEVERQRTARATEQRAGSVWTTVIGRLATYLPAHEREFYSLWPAQMATARDNVDITHLGPKAPRASSGEEERKYFADLRASVASTPANVRRVERVTPDKLVWIRALVKQLGGQLNFSLRAYLDPSDAEMPQAMSVCRVDDRFAWIVALAEQESTSGHRDLLITGSNGVEMIAQYFNERLWDRSIWVMEHGREVTGWEANLST